MALSRRSKASKLRLGTVTSVHGIRGEIKVSSLYPEIITLKKLWLNDKEFIVEKIRPHQSTLLIKLTGIETRNDAETCRGKAVHVSTDEVDEDVIFQEEIIGKSVIDRGRNIGKVSERLRSPAHEILVIKGDKEILIPNIKPFILEIGDDIIADLRNLEEE